MKKLLELGDRFAQQSDWKDFALTKFCLFAINVVRFSRTLPGPL